MLFDCDMLTLDAYPSLNHCNVLRREGNKLDCLQEEEVRTHVECECALWKRDGAMAPEYS